MSAPYYQDDSVSLHHGDALDVAKTLANGAVDCIVTSPPYFGLRDYGTEGQYGLEASPIEYAETMRALFSELRRVLADDGTLWLNLGDSYAGSWGNQGHDPKHADLHVKYRGAEALPDKRSRTGSVGPGMPAAKNLIGIPWRVALALQDDGWTLRNDIIWAKPGAMPESVTDRLSGKHEYVFMFSKSRRYWFDLDPIREPIVTQHPGALNWARESKEADVPGETHKQHRAGRPQATPPGAVPQTNFGPTGKRHGQSHPAGKNPGDVWEIATQPFPGAHFATMPAKLAQRCIAAGCKPGGTVLDPFSGSGTTGMVAQRLGRKYIGIDLNAEYLELSLRTRLQAAALDFEAGA
ncbi:DNA methylase N-4/N-6 [Mycobacteroides abscessus subsp. bolletii]|uniref:DNA-methyltransferase n=1 Tax=Mycobacteroides abscessus TaxID=36809 RepID=UPI0009A8F7DE|nr:site-specific DNA-methyltransferase [Mycobacteroides abscessus]SKS24264.1 DNA methylase N-4/N-6 [Mycobacteroides abscessus subsp. bolletii]SKS46574.1 DNA methylase N-4/N-6 [Mycobacteroides abscessus subsp. bolletii]